MEQEGTYYDMIFELAATMPQDIFFSLALCGPPRHSAKGYDCTP
jgi:hypothetical protein